MVFQEPLSRIRTQNFYHTCGDAYEDWWGLNCFLVVLYPSNSWTNKYDKLNSLPNGHDE